MFLASHATPSPIFCRSPDLPRRRSTLYLWISRAFRWPSPHRWNSRAFLPTCVALQVFPRFLDFPRILSTYVVSLEFPRFRQSSGYLSSPRFSSICQITPRSPASSISRVSRWSYIIIEFFCVARLDGYIAFLDLSCIECLHESLWI